MYIEKLSVINTFTKLTNCYNSLIKYIRESGNVKQARINIDKNKQLSLLNITFYAKRINFSNLHRSSIFYSFL